MNNNFPMIITQLRKEKKISQKDAAKDLEISQSLLSHYEKGIRECSLDFLIKLADYYEVSTDYLLGRTTQRYSDLFTLDDNNEKKGYSKITQLANKILLINTITVLYEYLIKIGSKKLSNHVSSYLMLAVYKIFRMIYSSNTKSTKSSMFMINKNVYKGFTSAAMQITSSEIDSYTNIYCTDEYLENCKNIDITPDDIIKEFPEYSQSVFNLISHSENVLKSAIKNT